MIVILPLLLSLFPLLPGDPAHYTYSLQASSPGYYSATLTNTSPLPITAVIWTDAATRSYFSIQDMRYDPIAPGANKEFTGISQPNAVAVLFFADGTTEGQPAVAEVQGHRIDYVAAVWADREAEAREWRALREAFRNRQERDALTAIQSAVNVPVKGPNEPDPRAGNRKEAVDRLVRELRESSGRDNREAISAWLEERLRIAEAFARRARTSGQ